MNLSREVTEPARAYFGTCGLADFPLPLQELARTAPQFIDVCAGTGRALCDLRMRGQYVVGNDRGFYPWSLMYSSLLRPIVPRDEWFKELANMLDPENLALAKTGVLQQRRQDHKAPFIDVALAEYIDTVCQLALQRTRPDISAAIGHVLIKYFTVRKTSWMPEERPFCRWPVNWFYDRLIEALWQTRMYTECYPERTDPDFPVVQAMRDDAAKCFKRTRVRTGAVAYANGAAPWRGQTDNPYEFFAYDLDEILLQRPVEPIRFWHNGEDALKDISQWAEAAFSHKCKYFAVVHESCAEPDPQWLTEQLIKDFKLQAVWKLQREAPNFDPFEEHTIVLEA